MPRSTRDPDILTAEELAPRIKIKFAQTIRDAATAGEVPCMPAGRLLLFSWKAFYEWLAGPGIPEGEILTARELAAVLGVSERLIKRSSAAPGTPGKLPGRRVGKQWRYALEAVRRTMRGSASAADVASSASPR